MSELGDQLLAIHDALDAARIPHAIGGAIALGYCTLEPRGTRDVDVNVFTAPSARGMCSRRCPRGWSSAAWIWNMRNETGRSGCDGGSPP